MAKTKYPYFAKSMVHHYCDDTEPKIYPDAYEMYVPKTELDEIQAKLDKAVEQRNEVIAWSLYGEGEEQMKRIDKLDAELAEIGKG